MTCAPRFLAMLTMALLVLLLVAPASAGNRSDARLFALAQAEAAAQDAAFQEAYGLYQFAPTASEKATALNDVEAALTESERRIAALEVRSCFRPWWRAVTDMWSLLAKAVGSIRTDEILTPAEIAQGSALLTLTRSGVLAGYFRCEGAR